MTRYLSLAAAIALLTIPVNAQVAPHLPPLDQHLPPRAEAIYRRLASSTDAAVAMEVVRFMAPLWRLAGNPAFEQSQQLIFDRLAAAGLRPVFDKYSTTSSGWEHTTGTLRLGGPLGEVLLSRETHRVALAINSYSTVPGGVTMPLIDLGDGTSAAAYEGKTVKGAVVLATGPLGAVFQQAVRDRGAAGVVSSDLAPYTRPAETPDVLQWGSVPTSDTLRSFGFKATPRAARRLRDELRKGPVGVHVEIRSTFHRKPTGNLVVEIPGTTRPEQRIVMVAHVQEPGANDNASGCGTLLSTVLAINAGITSGALPPPARTLTFIWGNEMSGSEQWVKANSEALSNVVAMMSLDMAGEDVTRTGGTFLIEKQPDPSAVWSSPSDPHSEWGASTVDPASLRGSFLNDLHLGVALRRARDTGWVVRTNPYEGGSDHTVFMRNGVPSLLNWHFTDRYYHTNLDTIDHVSAAEMQHVAIVVGTTALFLASAGQADLAPLTAMLAFAREARLQTERRNQASPEILAAWQKWYDEAIASVTRLQ